MGRVLFQVLGKIDDIDGFKGTFFHANTATCVRESRQKKDIR